MRKMIVAVFVSLMLILSACGGGESKEREQFEPASYGNDRTEQCYFVNDPDEVTQLKTDGKCEADWRAAPWPEDDFAGFYPFFFFAGGGSYRDRYVPTSKHTNYNSRISTFESNPAFKRKVSTLSPNAQYKSTTSGKIVAGNKVKSGTFGGGSRFSGGYGTRTKTCALSYSGATVFAKGGGSSGGGGSRGGGGGGSRSGGSKSSTTTKSKTGGC